MTYDATATIINILLTICRQYQELVLINQLNDFFNFDHNVFLLDSSADAHRFIDSRCSTIKQNEHTPQSVYIFKSVDSNITGLETLKEIKSKNTFLIVVPESSNFESNFKLLTKVKEIQLLNVNMKIGVFFSHIVSTDDLPKLFEWCWMHRIINIFAATNSDHKVSEKWNIFNFSPFGTFDVIKLRGNESLEKVFLSQFSNFKQHTLQMIVHYDGWTFIYSNDHANIGGPDGKLWKAVAVVLNASMMVTTMDYNIEPLKMARNATFDMFPQQRFIPQTGRINIYPLKQGAAMIIVPEALPYAGFGAYLRTITSDNFFFYFQVTIVSTMFLLSVCRYIKHNLFLFFQCAADVLNLLLNDNGSIKYRKLSLVENCLLVPLTFAGFIIVNGWHSTLQSYLTRPIIMPQINTIEDIYRSPFPILTDDNEWTIKVITVLESIRKKGDWSNKVVTTDYIDLKKQTTAYNTSISFLYSQSWAKLLIQHQKRLNIKGYHIPKEILLKSILAYFVLDDYPFIERLNEIIHRIQDAGLYEKWTGESYSELLANNYFPKKRADYFDYEETDIERFSVPIIIVYGWIAGVTVLFIEIIWNTFNSREL